MNLAKLDFDALKKMAVALCEAETEDGEKFYIGKRLKTIAISKENLAKDFDAAIKSVSDEVVNDLPEDIIDFYNEFFGEESGDGDDESAEKPAKEKKEKAEKPAKEKKEKAEKPAKEKKAKDPVELSCFGHKVGSQAAALDDLLEGGKSISLTDLSAKSGRSALGVKSHIKHLQDARGLKIEEKNGVYKLIK
jgi:biotin operon repressor